MEDKEEPPMHVEPIVSHTDMRMSCTTREITRFIHLPGWVSKDLDLAGEAHVLAEWRNYLTLR